METSGAKVRRKRVARLAFWIVLALMVMTTGVLLATEHFNIWIGPETFIITNHGPRSGILGGLNAISNGELDYGVQLIYYGLTRGVPGTINILLFAVFVVLGVYRLCLPRNPGLPAGAPDNKPQQ